MNRRPGTPTFPAAFVAKAPCMLPPWVSSCEIDGQVVFLDVLANRYSRLRKPAASALTSGHADALQPELRRNFEHLRWLNSKVDEARSSCCAIIRPAREHSAEFDLGSPTGRQIVSAFRSLVSARLAIAARGFDELLWWVQRHNAVAGAAGRSASNRSGLISAFEYVERVAVWKDRCLLRSIGLQHLLARNGYESTLVFGVRLHPFEAHCWLQDDDLILNDTVELVGPFKPIRAVR